MNINPLAPSLLAASQPVASALAPTNQPVVGALAPTDEELANLDENLDEAGEDMMIPNNADPLDVYIPRTKNLPGPKTWIKGELDGLRHAVLLELVSQGLHRVIANNELNPRWTAFYHLITGYKDLGDGRRMPMQMAAYKLHTGPDGPKKMRKFIFAGLEHDKNLYEIAIASGAEPTALQEDSFQAWSQRESAQRAFDRNAAAAAEHSTIRRRQNEMAEVMMGLRHPNFARGVNLPSAAAIAAAIPAANHLAPQPSAGTFVAFKRCHGLNVEAAMLPDGAMRLIPPSLSSPNSISPGTTRSRAAEEARIAAEAAAGATTAEHGPGEIPRQARHEDAHGRIDALADSMETDAAIMASAVKDVASAFSTSGAAAESPSKKKHRHFEEITANLKRLLDERKQFAEAGLSTDDVDEQIRGLQAERKMLNRAQGSGATANLGSAFGDAA